MALDKQQTHNPGALKQTNKGHKHGRHRSKGSISIATKGKVNIKTVTKKQKSELNKEQRRNQSKQIRQNKRDELLSKKRSLGGLDYSPFLVCVLPLNRLMDVNATLELLTKCDTEAIINKSPSGVVHVTLPRFKQRFSLVIPVLENDLAVLDALKVSDTVLFLISAAAGINFGSELVDKWGGNILTSAFAQGLPTPVVALTDIEAIPQKKQTEQRQNVQKLVSKWLPEEKVVNLAKSSDALNVFRRIGNQKRKALIYRDRRPHLYAENYEYTPEGTNGSLKVTGYLRGSSLSVNGLVYVPGLGAFQMSEIVAPNDPFVVEKHRNTNEMQEDAKVETIRVLAREDATKQESLQTENIPDPLDAEQTWPTAEDMKMVEEEKVKRVKKVPKGWSDYQAAWIPDEDAEEVSDLDDEESEDDGMDAMSEDKSESEKEDEEFDTMTESEVAVNDQQYDQQMDLYAEQSDLEKLKEAKTHKMFPDEIDTPQDAPARVRFQKYRGLESFRTSPWDPKENLPLDFARIFQFENFDRTKKRVLKEQEEKEGALPGWYITIHIKDIPHHLWNTYLMTNSQLVVIGLLPHENKMSVLNVVLKRVGSFDEPIKSKEKLIFQCGYRRFVANPVFSQHTNGKKHKIDKYAIKYVGTTENKEKKPDIAFPLVQSSPKKADVYDTEGKISKLIELMNTMFERFFQPESTAVATIYAPIQFPPAPVLCYKEVNGQLTLVATGNLLSVNPDRIVVKRIVLSGHPCKVHKRSAVIRFMFFNREDIIYFKPCKLRTKYGRIGHIKEPLGTHGHMKCIFDGQLKSQDTILLNLYKRVFPKWTFQECVVSCNSDENDDMET